MKFIILVLFFSMLAFHPAFAVDNSMRADVAERISHYAETSPKKLRFAILDDLSTFTEMDLTASDAELIQNVLKTLIHLEKFDNPRSGVLTVSDSYGRHKELYRKAAAAVETKKNKELLKELMQIMENFYENGNG